MFKDKFLIMDGDKETPTGVKGKTFMGENNRFLNRDTSLNVRRQLETTLEENKGMFFYLIYSSKLQLFYDINGIYLIHAYIITI